MNFAPGEPNGGTGESAVTLDMRGPQGIITSSGQARHGMWNDDQVNTTACANVFFSLGCVAHTDGAVLQRSDNYLLYPVCETSIPPARQGGIRIWGSGNSHTVNIKVCVDADDYLFFREGLLLCITTARRL